MKNLPIRMPDEIHQKIKQESNKRNISMNAVVMEMLNANYSGTSRIDRKLDKIHKLLKDHLDRNND